METTNLTPANQSIKRRSIHRHFDNVCDEGCQDYDDKLYAIRYSERRQPSVQETQNFIVQDGCHDYKQTADKYDEGHVLNKDGTNQTNHVQNLMIGFALWSSFGQIR